MYTGFWRHAVYTKCMETVSRRVVVLAAIVVGTIAAVAYISWPRASYTTAAVVRAPIVEEAFASGNVESPTTADLAFKASGKIVALTVSVGQHVAAGAVLAKQDASVLEAQYTQARANVSAAQAALGTLEGGATPQTIAVSQAALASAEQSLANAYATVGSTLADASAKANDAVVNQLARFFTNGNTNNPVLTFDLGDFALKNRIVAERAAANETLAALARIPAATATPAVLDAALASADNSISNLQALLTDAVSAAGKSVSLSTTDATAYRASAATGLSEVNAALAEVQALEHSIALAETSVASANASLNLTTASSTQTSIDAQTAAVAAAQANADAIAAQIRDLEIIAPASGTITDTNGTVGEVVGPNTAVVSLMPDAKLEVKVNVSEDNVVEVAVGDPATIELDAFPAGTVFNGTVSEIDPAATIVGGAVYYQTTIFFAKDYPDIRAGMTANAWIETASSSSALIVPVSALASTGTSTTVMVLENGVPVTRAVTVGIKSQDGMAEILSGLSAGEKVVTGS